MSSLRCAVLLVALSSASGLLPQAPLLRSVRSPHPRSAVVRAQLDDGLPEEPAPAPVPAEPAAAPAPEPVAAETPAAPAAVPGVPAVPRTADGKADLSKMSFDERLEYLTAQAANAVPMQKKEAEETMFGSDEDSNMFGIGDEAESQWWKLEFYKLCFGDLKEMVWPGRKQVFQTVITSQVAFVLILVLCLLVDAFANASVRTLLAGEPFSITIDAILKKPPAP